MSWCTIESDPGVFTELTEAFGVTGCEVSEFMTLDQVASFPYGPIYGLVFLFKVDGSVSHPPRDSVPFDDGVFFIRQTISNACATIALLNTVLNVPQDANVTHGRILSEFKENTTALDPESRGDVLESLEEVRKAHNSFTQEAFLSVDDKKKSKADPFHYVALVQNPAKPEEAVELDGLRDSAVAVPSDVPEDTPVSPDTPAWLKKAVAEVKRRMEAFTSAGELRFSLLGLHPARVPLLERRIAGASDDEKVGLEAELEDVRRQRAEWHDENVRRRHNYVPFIMALLKELSRQGKLAGLCESAVARAKTQMQSRAGRMTE